MNAQRRAWLIQLSGAAPTALLAHGVHAETDDEDVHPGRRLNFPRDHGAHLGANIEWWYLTGWLGSFAAPQFGFQLTFFRTRTGLAQTSTSRFAARHLLFAHAALTDLQARQHHHAQRLERWSGHSAVALGAASSTGMDVHIGAWSLRDQGHVLANAPAQADAGFSLALRLQRSQPVLLQGIAGYSAKAAQNEHASHYTTEPQLQTQATLTLGARQVPLEGRAWLDHEWSQGVLHPEAVGWDWIGMNLADGSALTAFQLRRQDGSAMWAGGSWRTVGGEAQNFKAADLRFEPGRLWASQHSAARYPVQWRVHTPVGRFTVNALLDNQEMDARRSTGLLYWEGLAELQNEQAQRVGLGYLELTGYGQRLTLG